jgi:hypothetical protein
MGAECRSSRHPRVLNTVPCSMEAYDGPRVGVRGISLCCQHRLICALQPIADAFHTE